MSRPLTPCIGICSTSIGDPVCRGCKRFNHEVFHWNGYTTGEKQNVLKRLEDLLERVMGRYLTVTDEAPLESFLKAEAARPSALTGKAAKALLVLRLLNDQRITADKPDELKSLGLIPQEDYQSMGPTELFRLIEQDYYALALAYYDANFLRAYQQDG